MLEVLGVGVRTSNGNNPGGETWQQQAGPALLLPLPLLLLCVPPLPLAPSPSLMHAQPLLCLQPAETLFWGTDKKLWRFLWVHNFPPGSNVCS